MSFREVYVKNANADRFNYIGIGSAIQLTGYQTADFFVFSFTLVIT